MNAQAAKFFKEEQYLQATPLYARLLALHAKDFDYNFHYGACLLYNSSKKQDAIKYLVYAVTDPQTAPEAWFFLGKAYHLNYQFNEAIKNYSIYLEKAPKEGKVFDAEHEIQMCQNGKRLMTTLSDLIVLEKKEIEESKFFRIYDLKDIGGTILVTAEFQTKLDKKNNHIPVIHFPQNPTMIFYSSYGENGKSGKDIYVRRKLPDGSWGLPQPVPGNVNTPYDEDFPYMHPDGEYLYFSSKGHNSMGGYDVFRSKYDPETNSFGPPENLDFAISSPDDDLMYVVDSTNDNAFFASARQSEAGKLFVYKVKVTRVPLQLAVVKGNFSSEVNPSLKKINFEIRDYANGDLIGKFNSNDKAVYLITFPKGGKYEYIMKIDGVEQEFRTVVSIPFMKEFKPLKQKIVHTTENGIEQVKIINLFNEEVDDPAAVLAEVIKMRAELNVNVEEFDLNELESGKKTQELIQEAGYGNLSLVEIRDVLKQLNEKTEENSETINQVLNNINLVLVENGQEFAEASVEMKQLVAESNVASTTDEKFEKLLEAEVLINEQKQLTAYSNVLSRLKDSVQQVKSTSIQLNQLEKLREIEKSFNELLDAGKENDAVQLLIDQKKILQSSSTDKSTNLVPNIVDQLIEIDLQMDKIREQDASYQQDVQKLQIEIQTLENSYYNAKKKDLESIDAQIDAKKEEVELIQGERKKLDRQLNSLASKKSSLNKQVEIVQDAVSIHSPVSVNENQVKNAVDELRNTNNNSLVNYVGNQLNELEKKDPTLRERIKINSDRSSSDIYSEYKTSEQGIEDDSSLSKTEKLYKKLNNDRQVKSQVKQRQLDVGKALEENPENPELLDEQTQNTQILAEIDSQIAVHEKQVNELVASTNSGETSIVHQIQKDYDSRQKEILENTQLSDKEKTAALKTEDEKLLAAVNRELLETTDKLKTEPGNSQLEAKKVTLTQLKQKTELAIQKEDQELLTSGEKYKPKQQTDEELLLEIQPDYSAQIEAVSADENRSPIEKKAQLISVNEQLIPEIDAAIKEIDQHLNEQEQNEFLEVKKSRLLELKATVETMISQEKEALISLKSTEFATEITEKSSQEETALTQQLARIEKQTTLSESEKISQKQEALKNYLKNFKKLQNELAANKEIDQELKSVLTVKTSVDQKIVEAEKELEALELKQQKLAEKPVPTVAELKQTEFTALVEKLPEEFKKMTTDETEKALNQAISRDELLLENIQTAQIQLKNQENGQQSGMQQAYEELIDSLQTDQQQLINKLDKIEKQKAFALEQEKQAENTINQEDTTSQVLEAENKSNEASVEPETQEKIVLKSNDELVPDYALMKQQLQEEESEPVVRLNDLISLENKLLNSLQFEVDSLQKSKVSSESERAEALQILENRIAEQKQQINALNQQLQTESVNKKELDQPETVLNNTTEKNEQLSSEQEIHVAEKTLESLKNELFSAGFTLNDPLSENESELTKLDAQLKNYEVKVQDLIQEEQQNPNDETLSKKTVYEQELETIQQKRRQIKLEIDDLEHVGDLSEDNENKVVVVNNNPQLTGLKNEEKELEARLIASESRKEQKEIQRDLTENRREQVQVENEELVVKIGQEDSVLNVKQKQLADLEKQQNSTDKPLAEQTDYLTDESLNQQEKATNSKSVSEKNYWLKEAEKTRVEAVRLTSEALIQTQIELVEEQTGLILESEAELEQHKRRLLLEIGTIEQLEDELDEKLTKTPKKEQQSALDQQKYYAERKKELLRQLDQTEDKIVQLKKKQPVSSIPQEAIREAVSIQEEYQLSMETSYKNYTEKMQQVFELEKQLSQMDSQLEMQKKNILNDIKSESKSVDLNSREMQLQIEQLNKLEKERNELMIHFQRAQKQAEAELPADEQMKLKMQNMGLRGIAPVDKLLVAASLVTMPVSGITYAAKAENSISKPIPVDVIEPSGLVYRVQVGAFAKPIPEMLFSEFTPVSGEKLGNGITRYLAGYFNNDHAVQLARNEIRNLGYSDAFVVAYCDGKRVTLAEAREMEAKGTCIPKGVNELVLEVQLNTAEKLGLEDSVKKKKVSNLTYNQAPGAVKADAIEQYEGLFYTVQVGVYNQPVTTGILMNIKDLKTLRLSNGQIRYSSGMFASADEASPRKAEAIQSGVTDAFITAYYKGERISVDKADKILAKQGSDILVMNQQTKIVQSPVILETVKTEEVRLADTLADDNLGEKRNYQLVSTAAYSEFPRDVLNRYNVRGVFYYDETDGHVKSEPVGEKELLPNVRGISQDVDTVEYLVEKVNELNVVCLTFAGNRLSGDVADWLIRYNFQREIQKLENELIVKLFVPDQQKEQLEQMATERKWQFKLIQNDKKEEK